MALEAFRELGSVGTQQCGALQQQVRLEPAIAMMAGLETKVPASTGYQVDQAFGGNDLR